MNNLKEAIKDYDVVKRIQELENVLDASQVLNTKIAKLKSIQKQMINAKNFNQHKQYLVYKDNYEALYEEILNYPFVEEYIELLNDANNMLLDVSHIIESKINEKLK